MEIILIAFTLVIAIAAVAAVSTTVIHWINEKRRQQLILKVLRTSVGNISVKIRNIASNADSDFDELMALAEQLDALQDYQDALPSIHPIIQESISIEDLELVKNHIKAISSDFSYAKNSALETVSEWESDLASS